MLGTYKRQETLDKVPQRAQLLGGRGKGQTDGLGLVGSKSKCGRGWGCGMGSASPRDAGFTGTRGAAGLPPIHHVDEWSRVKHCICQEPSLLASLSSVPAPVPPVSAWGQVLKFTHVSETRHPRESECSSDVLVSEPHSPFLN